jgi:hypothetical protein
VGKGWIKTAVGFIYIVGKKFDKVKCKQSKAGKEEADEE